MMERETQIIPNTWHNHVLSASPASSGQSSQLLPNSSLRSSPPPPNKLTSNHLPAILRNCFKKKVMCYDPENMDSAVRNTWVPTPALPSPGYAITGKLLNFFEPQFLF